MILIVGHHYVRNGLLSSTLTGRVTNLWIKGARTARSVASLLYPRGRVGNYIFFMLSGNFLVGRKKGVKTKK